MFSPLASRSSVDSGFKDDTGFAIEWSAEEQRKLEEGLVNYASENSIMRYVKLAATLPDKTLRDVVLRCKWMAEVLGESSLENSNFSASSARAFAWTTRDSMISGAMISATRHLLEENEQAFCQISANLSSLKLQQNIYLFLRAKHNISRILNDMSSMPGIMSRMPPLPVRLNEELASRFFCPQQRN